MRRQSNICMRSFEYIPGVRLSSADVSEPSVGSICLGLLPVLEDGIDRGFRNVGRTQTDAGDVPKRTHTIFKTRRKPEIKSDIYSCQLGVRHS